jgi:hypothetical protein
MSFYIRCQMTAHSEIKLSLMVRPPPSSRLWFSFIGPPEVQFDTTPIISSSEISSSLVKGWLESRFLQVIEEGLVLPDGGEDISWCTAEEV